MTFGLTLKHMLVTKLGKHRQNCNSMITSEHIEIYVFVCYITAVDNCPVNQRNNQNRVTA